MHVVAAINVPAGRFDEVQADSYDGAWFVARHLSKQNAGVSFGAYEVRGDGTYLLASFLNGERRFTASSEGAARGFEWPEGAKRALNRLAGQGKPLSPAVVLEEAERFGRLEDTPAAADARELYDYITAGQREQAGP